MKTPPFIAAGLVAVALAACGSPDAQAPASGGSMSSLEPIDAVPLPLDDIPLSPPPVAEPVKAADKVEDTDATKEVAAEPLDPAALSEPTVKPPRIVVAPQEPASPTPKPATPPAPGETERPVLNF